MKPKEAKNGPASGCALRKRDARIVTVRPQQVKGNSDLRQLLNAMQMRCKPAHKNAARCSGGAGDKIAVKTGPLKWDRRTGRNNRYSFKSPNPVDCSPPSSPPRRPRL